MRHSLEPGTNLHERLARVLRSAAAAARLYMSYGIFYGSDCGGRYPSGIWGLEIAVCRYATIPSPDPRNGPHPLSFTPVRNGRIRIQSAEPVLASTCSRSLIILHGGNWNGAQVCGQRGYRWMSPLKGRKNFT